MGEIVSIRKSFSVVDVLSRYTLDELSLLIGFHHGSHELHKAGYTTLAALVRAAPQELMGVPGIGARKLAIISEFFASHGVTYPTVPPQGSGDVIRLRRA